MAAQRIVMFCVLCGLTASYALAEPPGNRESFFRAMREAIRENPDQEILEFALHPNLPGLLELEPKQLEPFRKQVSDTRFTMYKLHDEHKESRIEHDALVTRMQKISTEGTRKAIGALQETGKWERIMGLFVQVRGPSAAATEAIAAKISLKAEQLAEFRAARRRLWEKHMRDVGEAIQSAMRSGKRDPQRGRRIAEMMEDAKKKLNTELRRMLTEEQQEALDALSGEEVEGIREKLDVRKRPGGRGRGPRPGERRGERPNDLQGDHQGGRPRDHQGEPRPRDGQRPPKKDPGMDPCVGGPDGKCHMTVLT